MGMGDRPPRPKKRGGGQLTKSLSEDFEMQHAHPGSGGAARGTGKGRAGTRSSVVGFAGGNTKTDNPIADFAVVPIVPKKQARPRTTACQRCP